MKVFRVVITIAVFLCLVPILSTLIAAGIAGYHGCRLHEGFANPCVINGTDYGGVLYDMSVMGFFVILTLPAAVLLLLVWGIVEWIRSHQLKRGT